MWLMGQLLNDLLPGGSSSSSAVVQREQQLGHGALSMPFANVDKVDEEFFVEMLEMSYSCVEWLGSQLCHMQLPGDDAATLSISFSPEDAAARMPLLRQLLQQHAQLQTAMYVAVQCTAAAGLSGAQQHDIKSTAAAALLQHVWGDALPGQLRAFGAAVAAALPVGWACNNAACTNLGKLSELQLVTGKAKVCAGCKQVHMCSAECQKQHWKAGHKMVCKKLAAAAAAAEGQGTAASSDSAAANAGSCGSGAGSSSSSAVAAAAAAAGLELPTSAAAAAGRPVRQLKALLVALGVAGVAGAVEKCELVQLLVGHLGLA
jgi:hypothetical protein